MKTRILLSLIACATLILTSCTMGPTTPVCYALVANINTPGIQAVTSPDGSIGSKKGEASVFNICCLTSFGDSSIPAAARNGNISNVKTVAYTYNNVFYIFQRGTTVVTGD